MSDAPPRAAAARHARRPLRATDRAQETLEQNSAAARTRRAVLSELVDGAATAPEGRGGRSPA